ncbi:helix-turn-helix domain-containing protein [Streptomyces omiyaensis]|uniref:helix-turn-helix domain-containing protein n=1 Tax=Streptomyces omiyaensis TaxID=68247 RepID=UPI0036FD1A17
MTSSKALSDLALWLREQRARSGRTYRELATRTKCAATTLQRAASGDAVPSRATVLSYARACDASAEVALKLWKAAKYEAATNGRRNQVPKPDLIWNLAELSRALIDLYLRAGAPPLRLMETRAGGLGLLPRSAAHRIVKGLTIPFYSNQFKAFLKACEVPDHEHEKWVGAWARAIRTDRQEHMPDAVDLPEWYVPRDQQEAAPVNESPWFVTHQVYPTYNPGGTEFAPAARREDSPHRS